LITRLEFNELDEEVETLEVGSSFISFNSKDSYFV